jgi:hypothetical protein
MVTKRNGELAQVQSGGLDLEDPETLRLKIRRTDNTMAKRKMTKVQTYVHI